MILNFLEICFKILFLITVLIYVVGIGKHIRVPVRVFDGKPGERKSKMEGRNLTVDKKVKVKY